MTNDSQALISGLHKSAHRGVFTLTGGGSGLISALLSVPGASRTVIESHIPYAETALTEYLGYHPDQACSSDTARSIALRSLDRALCLLQTHRNNCSTDGEVTELFGFAATCGLATDRSKRGDHRAHIAIATTDKVRSWTVVLDKGARSRAEEELVITNLSLWILADHFHTDCGDIRNGLSSADVFEQHADLESSRLDTFASSNSPFLAIAPDGQIGFDFEPGFVSQPRNVLSGSFNPLHYGHLTLARAVETMTGMAVMYELSVANADKPDLVRHEIRQRVSQFQWRAPLVLTREPLFVGKSRVLPDSRFVVGFDTAERLLDASYYGCSEELLLNSMATIRGNGCSFLVAGRETDGVYRTMNDLKFHSGVVDLFEMIPESAFRADISSSRIRSESE